MADADLALLLTALACLALRIAGLAVAGALRPDHPFVAWAAAVAQATLAAFVVLAVAAPSGALAALPLAARIAALAAGLIGYAAFGRRLLPALLVGLAALVLLRAV
ncbi:hypothetical protein [Caldovatus aquaticus]|uniref:AzlD domain-containing protein n=1 Tax=Caldovatus aquaticus TaxID=2865671 RepID=A0ABS7F661_9PROT|nr:hypothetical protein [Caldovatus aquaticus]MBW8270793.1 hypothetical protein [Caldovatus aquaticus]